MIRYVHLLIALIAFILSQILFFHESIYKEHIRYLRASVILISGLLIGYFGSLYIYESYQSNNRLFITDDSYYGLQILHDSQEQYYVFSDSRYCRWMAIGHFDDERFVVEKSCLYYIRTDQKHLFSITMNGKKHYIWSNNDERLVLIHSGKKLTLYKDSSDTAERIEGMFSINDSSFLFSGDILEYENTKVQLHYLGHNIISMDEQIISDFSLYQYSYDSDGNLVLRELDRDEGRVITLKRE